MTTMPGAAAAARLSWSLRPLVPAALLAAALALVLAAVVLGGSPAAFVDVPALLVVVGGTVAVTGSSYPPADLAQAGRSVAASLGAGPPPPALLAEVAVDLAETARRDGLLALERRLLPDLAAWPVLRRGLELAVDGVTPDALGRALWPAVEAEVALHVRAVALLRRAADVAPAMGLVGTLVGLVQMLGQLDRPDAIGPAMAVALLTTLYGAMIAHMLLLPLAERVAGLAARLAGCRELEADLARAIAAGEHPRRLRDRLAPLPARAGVTTSEVL